VLSLYDHSEEREYSNARHSGGGQAPPAHEQASQAFSPEHAFLSFSLEKVKYQALLAQAAEILPDITGSAMCSAACWQFCRAPWLIRDVCLRSATQAMSGTDGRYIRAPAVLIRRCLAARGGTPPLLQE